MNNVAEVLKLNNAQLEELSVEEMQEVDGGIIPFLIAAGYITTGAAVVGVGYAGGKWVGKHVFKK